MTRGVESGRGRLQWFFLLVVVLLQTASCGEVTARQPDAGTQPDSPPGSTNCVLDQSTLDNCTL